MAKSNSFPGSKGRWLEVDSKSESHDQVLAAVKKIDGVDIHEISGKTYIRFPTTQPKKGTPAFHMTKIAGYRRPTAKKQEEDSNFRQYCAVIQKNK